MGPFEDWELEILAESLLQPDKTRKEKWKILQESLSELDKSQKENREGFVRDVIFNLDKIRKEKTEKLPYVRVSESKTKNEGKSTMNLRNVAAFTNDNITTVKAVFRGNNKEWTYKIPLELAAKIKADDFIVVEAGDGDPYTTPFSVAKVVKIDAESDIDPNATFEYKWCFAIIDFNSLKSLQEQENELVKNLRKFQRDKMKADVMRTLLGQTPSPEAMLGVKAAE